MLRAIYLVDDDDEVRSSLHGLLSLHNGLAVRSFRSGEEFLGIRDKLAPGVILLDFNMPGATGLDVLETLSGSAIRFVTIMLTGQADISLAVKALKAGAFDFVEKPYSIENLLVVIDAAFERLDSDATFAQSRKQAQSKIDALTRRERDVLRGLVDGQANKVIARSLDISPRTVEIYRANLMTKIGVSSLSEVIRIAFQAGLISDTSP